LRADAATLLAQAEEAGSAGRFAGASRLYGELARTFPGTREEIVARALHGQLLLDRMGSPGRALGLFEAYLNAAPDGTLAEEARLGRARSLQRLGRSSEERSAWRDFLSAHPRSVHAAAAHARLTALDAP
jgi:tetratricopeptide (TPR) repeat protein